MGGAAASMLQAHLKVETSAKVPTFVILRERSDRRIS